MPEVATVARTLAALGGGVLLAAVALELVPQADALAGAGLTALGLVTGTAVYIGADSWLNRDENMRSMRRSAHAAAVGQPMLMTGRPNHGEAARGESIAAGLVVDGVPESIALGLTIAEGEIASRCSSGS